MKQFPIVSSTYGAPMGRRNSGHNDQLEAHTVRLFKVRINSGGYDDGGAYWGLGAPIYCATNDAGYFETIRAASRLQAIVGLELSADCLKAAGIILRQKPQTLGL